MNKRILHVLGSVLTIMGGLMALPMAVGLIYGEWKGAVTFLICAALCLIVGFPLTRLGKGSSVFTVKDGYLSVALCWLVMSLIGALPFTLSGEIPSYLDALFEIVSGFTTTGSSILSDVEALSRCMLFWRSFSHWIGGMGVLVFVLMLLPLADSGSSFSLMQAESPGPIVTKLVPRLKASARSLYGIYIGMTALLVLLLALGGMPLFDNLCITFGTVGTGGFGILNDSCASYSPYIQWVLSIFMLLAGTNFGLYFLLLCRQFKAAAQIEEVRWYYAIVFLSVLFISLNLLASGQFTSLREVVFQVASIITTSGFATTDFDLWPLFSRFILVLLMFCGACAGSTGGGIKISRLIIYCKTFLKELHTLTKPRLVRTVRMDGKKLENAVIHGALLFLVAYVLVFLLSMLLLCLEPGITLETAFTAVAATLNNIGPGLAQVGPTCNFGFLSPLSKLVLTFDMLAGRLEIFPVMILCSKNTWK